MWFHVSPRNVRSQRALERIGARFDRREMVLVGGGLVGLHPDDFKKAWEAIREFHKHLRQWSW